MSSKYQIVQELADEWGKASPEALKRIEDKVGEITVDLLSQNDCRFAGLRENQTITVTAGTTVYKLAYDFATLIKQVTVVDSDGAYLDKFEVVDEPEFNQRMSLGGYGTTRFGYIKFMKDGTDGPGWYLVLGGDWEETGYISLPYYREPTPEDTELIHNTKILKSGVRAEFPDLNPKAQQDLVMYERGKSVFRESPDTTTTSMKLRPSERSQRLNRLKWKIGGGL